MKYLIAVLMFFVIISGVYADNSAYAFTPQDNDNLEWVGSWPFGPCFHSVTDTLRELCFLQSGGGVYILDISDPVIPVKISERIHTNASIYNLYYDYQHQWLFISTWFQNLWDSTYFYIEIWDVSSSDDPQFLSRVNWPSYCCHVQDSLLYIPGTEFYPGYKVFDISDPVNVQELFYYHEGSYINDLCFKDTLLVISSDSIYILNNSDPLNPTIISTIANVNNNIAFLNINNNYLFALYAYHLLVIDISDPLNPQQVDSCSKILPYSTIFHRDFIYLTESNDLEIIDISDPTNCFSTGIFNINNNCINTIQISGYEDYIFFPDVDLIIVDVSDSSNPQEISRYKTHLVNYDFDINNNYIYLLDYNYGLRIIDISNISNPVEVADCSLPGNPESIVFHNNYVYIGSFYDSSSSYLEVVDVQNPHSPTLVTCCTLPYNHLIDEIATDNNLLYLSPKYIFDISDPINPILISELPVNGFKMVLDNNLGYLITGENFYIIDLNDPYHPQIRSSIYEPGFNMDIYEDYAFIQYSSGYMSIVDISDPDNPWRFIQVGLFQGGGDFYYWGIDVQQDYAAVISNNGMGSSDTFPSRLYLTNITDLNNPYIEDYVYLPNKPIDVIFSDQYIFASSIISGIQIFRYPPTTGIVELPVNNPLTSIILNTTIFPLSRHSVLELSSLPSEGSVSIYSVDGRKIFDEDFLQSNFSLNLNNMNISSGVYFIKISDQQGNDLTIRKFEVLK